MYFTRDLFMSILLSVAAAAVIAASILVPVVAGG